MRLLIILFCAFFVQFGQGFASKEDEIENDGLYICSFRDLSECMESESSQMIDVSFSQSIPDGHFKQILTLIKRNRCIELFLFNCELTKKQKEKLFFVLSGNTGIKVLDLGYNQIDDEDLSLLGKELQMHPTIKEIHINDNPAITDQGMFSLSRALQDCAMIQEIDIRSNPAITGQSVFNLARISTLRSVRVSSSTLSAVDLSFKRQNPDLKIYIDGVLG